MTLMKLEFGPLTKAKNKKCYKISWESKNTKYKIKDNSTQPPLCMNGNILGNIIDFYSFKVKSGQNTIEHVPDEIKPYVCSKLEIKSFYTEINKNEKSTLNNKAEIIAASMDAKEKLASKLNKRQDSNSLIRWEREIKSRKKIYSMLSKHFCRSVSQALMNSGDNVYCNRLNKELLDRVLPLISNGNSLRVTDECWYQPQEGGRFFDEEIRLTRTKRDVGQLPPIEYIACPTVIKNVKYGCNEKTAQNSMFSKLQGKHPWHVLSKPDCKYNGKSYKKERLKSVQRLIEELVPYQPDLNELAIQGYNSTEKSQSNRFSIEENSYLKDCPESVSQIMHDSKLPAESSDCQECVEGPLLILNDIPLKRIESDSPLKPTIAEICFKCKDLRPCHRSIRMSNKGTTVLYFNWKHLPKLNKLKIPQHDNNVFFFDQNNGIIRPRETKVINFSFKSTKEGFFTEIWEFQTTPHMKQAGNAVVCLYGNSFWSEEHPKHLWMMNPPSVSIEKQATTTIIKEILINIIRDIDLSKPKLYLDMDVQTDIEICEQINSSLYFSTDAIRKLRELFFHVHDETEIDEIEHETIESPTINWNMCIDSINQDIIDFNQSGQISDAKATELIQQLNSIVCLLCKTPLINIETNENDRHTICKNVIAKAILKSYDCCVNLRCKTGLYSTHEIDERKSLQRVYQPAVFSEGLKRTGNMTVGPSSIESASTKTSTTLNKNKENEMSTLQELRSKACVFINTCISEALTDMHTIFQELKS